MSANPFLAWSSLAQDLSFGLIVVDESLRIQYWNNCIGLCSSQELDQCLNQPLSRIFPAADTVRFRQLIARARHGNGYTLTQWPGRLTSSEDAGEEGSQTLLTFAFPSEKSTPWYAIALLDDTELDLAREGSLDALLLKSQLEQANTQLMQSEKLAAIGQLAAGVAHEINNPVGYVYSNLQTLGNYVESLFSIIDGAETIGTLDELRQLKRNLDYEYIREDVAALVAESREGIERVKNIIIALKDFSHIEEEEEFCLADLHKGLDSTLNVVNNEIKYKAEVCKEYGDLPEVACIPSQINQVVLNLLVNAAHAIEDLGRICLRTGVDNGWCFIEVEDNGKGIPPDKLDRIYEPFFTTKPMGKGTGLGLALSMSIVQKHNGRIDVASEPGKGSRFRVWLPVTQPEPDPGQEDQQQ